MKVNLNLPFALKRSLYTIWLLVALIEGRVPAIATVTWTSNSQHLVYGPSGQFYAYAPSVIVSGNEEHIFVCQNQNAGVIKDSIYYLHRVNGTIVQSSLALSAGATGAWDSYHVCDPNVIQGSFLMSGVTYSYALFYTGNDRNSSLNNQAGVAFANNLAGPWTKYPYPLIFNTFGTTTWGVGQPSVTSVNGAGDILIFYTQGTASLTSGMMAHLDIHNMGGIVTYFYQQVTNNRLTDINGNPDYLNNYDMVYDSNRDRFYVIREQRPYPTNFPTFISSSQQVASIPGANIWAGNGTWTPEAALTPQVTGIPRNHNAGIKRSSYGTLLTPGVLPVMFTSSCQDNGTGDCTWPGVLWTYHVWEIQGNIN